MAGLLSAGFLWSGYKRAVADGEVRADFLSRILQEQTLRNFEAADLVLQGMAAFVSRIPLPEHDPTYEQALRERLKSLPHVRALFIIGPDGFIIQDTDHPHTPRVSLADRAYFKAHQTNPTLGLFIAPPVLSRSVNRWFVSVSRPVIKPDGAFGGVAVAAVEPSFYQQFYAELGLGPQDAVTLLHIDTTLIARYPVDPELIGKQLPDLDLFRTYLPASPRGTFVARSEVFQGRTRIVSYRAVPDTPLVLSVSLDRATLLAGWRERAITTALVFVLCAALALMAAMLWSEQRRVRNEMRHRAVMTQKLEALGQMTGGIAHDFKNLIAAADAGLTLALKHVGDSAKVHRYISMAREALQRGNTLTSQLLAFAKQQELEIKIVDVNDLVRGLEPLLRQAAGSGVEVTFRYASSLPPCRADQAQFDAALVNLVVNARDAMSQGGTIQISTRLWEQPKSPKNGLVPGHYACVQVKDDGPGMPPNVSSRAFDPFFTTKGEQGTGLGLAQVYGFMRQIGGEARIESAVGFGTTIELYFPFAPPAEK